jgi:hypothetical protein
MLYYLGKFDDKKKEYARNWSRFTEIASESTTDANKIVDKLLENLSSISRTPTFTWILNSLSEAKQNGLDRVDELKKLAPEAANLFGVADLIEWHMKFISIYMGAAIVTSFAALFMFPNRLIQIVWPLFFLTLTLMISAAKKMLR